MKFGIELINWFSGKCGCYQLSVFTLCKPLVFLASICSVGDHDLRLCVIWSVFQILFAKSTVAVNVLFKTDSGNKAVSGFSDGFYYITDIAFVGLPCFAPIGRIRIGWILQTRGTDFLLVTGMKIPFLINRALFSENPEQKLVF